MTDATPDSPSYDYIVVGSGAGGGPLAANLAVAGYHVLLLEAGDDEGENPNYQVPAFACTASEDPAMAWEYFVRHYGSDDRQRRDTKYVAEQDGVFYPRAGTLGGCTAHNAMITMYPHNSDWDGIASLTGDSSWNSDRMRAYFERLECCHYRPLSKFVARVFGWNPGRRGFSGWLPTTLANPLMVARDGRLLRAIRSSVHATLGALRDPIGRIWRAITGMLDPNDWSLVQDSAEGVRLTPLAIEHGRRFGTRDYIRRAEREARGSLTVSTGSLATRVVLDERNRATGVEYLEGRHRYRADPATRGAAQAPDQVRRVAHAAREVIVAAGAFNTPQLLMLSGIGPREELARFGIPLRVELPGVGSNLQDRYEVAVVIRMKHDFELLQGATFKAPAPGEPADPYYRDWLRGSGPYAVNGAVFSVSKRSSKAGIDPDLFIFSGVGDFRGYRPGYSSDLFRNNNRFTWCVLKAHTANRGGRVSLRSADPCDMAAIDFHYFDEGTDAAGDDLEAVCDGVEFARELSSHLGDLAAEEVPGPAVATRDQLREFVKNEAWGHHASCSCRIGPDGDPMAVLDSRFRVRGTHNLRVVDASVFPRIPGFFIVTAVYMISEKATVAILEDARASSASR